MPTTEKKLVSKKIAFLDFKPAELKFAKDWLIIYYIKNPETNNLERKRVRVPSISNKNERLKYAKKMVFEINKKLARFN
jgi:integrase/recombinase XerD